MKQIVFSLWVLLGWLLSVSTPAATLSAEFTERGNGSLSAVYRAAAVSERYLVIAVDSVLSVYHRPEGPLEPWQHLQHIPLKEAVSGLWLSDDTLVVLYGTEAYAEETIQIAELFPIDITTDPMSPQHADLLDVFALSVDGQQAPSFEHQAALFNFGDRVVLNGDYLLLGSELYQRQGGQWQIGRSVALRDALVFPDGTLIGYPSASSLALSFSDGSSRALNQLPLLGSAGLSSYRVLKMSVEGNRVALLLSDGPQRPLSVALLEYRATTRELALLQQSFLPAVAADFSPDWRLELRGQRLYINPLGSEAARFASGLSGIYDFSGQQLLDFSVQWPKGPPPWLLNAAYGPFGYLLAWQNDTLLNPALLNELQVAYQRIEPGEPMEPLSPAVGADHLGYGGILTGSGDTVLALTNSDWLRAKGAVLNAYGSEGDSPTLRRRQVLLESIEQGQTAAAVIAELSLGLNFVDAHVEGDRLVLASQRGIGAFDLAIDYRIDTFERENGQWQHRPKATLSGLGRWALAEEGSSELLRLSDQGETLAVLTPSESGKQSLRLYTFSAGQWQLTSELSDLSADVRYFSRGAGLFVLGDGQQFWSYGIGLDGEFFLNERFDQPHTGLIQHADELYLADQNEQQLLHYQLDGSSTWQFQARLLPPGAVQRFATALSPGSAALAVAAEEANGDAVVYVYQRLSAEDDSWRLVDAVYSPEPYDSSFGEQMHWQGSQLWIASPRATTLWGKKAGLVRVYQPVLGGGNQAPYFTSKPVEYAGLETGYRYRVRARDHNGDALSLALLEGPAWLSLSGFDLVAPPLSPNQVGEYSVVLALSDGQYQVEQRFTLLVSADAGDPYAGSGGGFIGPYSPGGTYSAGGPSGEQSATNQLAQMGWLFGGAAGGQGFVTLLLLWLYRYARLSTSLEAFCLRGAPWRGNLRCARR